MNTQKILVILATYNPTDYLDVQVESILNQKGVRVEIIIFDDGSSCGTERILSLVNNSNNIRIVNNTPSGSPGRNFIRAISQVEIADNDWIALSDQDDIWLPEKLSEAVNYASIHSADGYSSDLTIYDGKNETGIIKKVARQREFDHFFQGASAGCTYLLSRNLMHVLENELNQIDVFNVPKEISHDWLVYFLCRINNLRWAHDERSFILYRQHDNNSYGANVGLFGALRKAKGLFDGFYSSNRSFMVKFTRVGDNPLLQQECFFSRMLFCHKAFEFRRKKREALVAYLSWLFRQV